MQSEESHHDLCPDGELACWLHDPATRKLIRANDSAMELYGWDDDVAGTSLEAVATNPSDCETLLHPTAGSFVDGGSHTRRKGPPIRVDVNVQEKQVDGRPAMLVTVIDVSDRKLDEVQLLKRERQLADAQELAHVGSFEWELDGDIVRWSDELFRIYGLRPQEFRATYAAFLERIHPDDRDRIDQSVRRSVETGLPFEMEERIIRPDGSERILETRGRFIAEQRRLIGACRDVTELREAARARDLLASQEIEARRKAESAHAEISEILERITDAFVALDRNWRYIYVNEKAAQIFGRDREELVGKHIWTEFPEGVGQPFHLAYEKAMQTQEAIQIEEYYPPYQRWFENRIHPSPRGLAIYFQDVTERKRRENELRELHDRMARTEEFSLVMVTMVTMDGYFSKVPSPLCKLLGYTPDELLKIHVEELIHPDDLEADRQHRDRIARGDARSLDIELRLLTRAGQVVWVYLNCSAVFDSDGQQTHFIVYLRDITERHRAEERIRHQALHDDLTGLPNRVLFNDRLGQAIAHAHRSNSCLAVLTLDLDTFKFVNDNLGHSIGDIVIRDVAGRLRTALRSTDTIARLGGDEFAIIIEDIENDGHARSIADKALAIFEDPFDAGANSVRVTCSVGISVYPRDGHDGEMLFRNSESALAKAKESGHGYVKMFDESMSARYRDRLVREQELREAIDDSQLTSYYQPILRGEDRRIVGVEALSRWNHPQRGVVGPEEFIPLAEETRMIVAIGEFVLRRGCLDVKHWIDQGHDLRLSVNLSVRQFHEKTLLHTIDSILAETKFDPSRLELEVTETVAMQNADLTMSLLRELRQRGISIAIDDFGVGQTSLIYLRQFPINTIKIDKVFINDILTDATDAAIVKTIVELAHTLGLCATAEGVESEEQMVMLQEFGCDLLQGFHFSRPVPSTTLGTLLSA